MEKPKEPRPADFGLTAERIAEFEASAAVALMRRRGAEIIVSSALLAGVIVFAYTRDIAMMVVALLGGWLVIVPAIMVVIDLWAAGRKAGWPDHDAYSRFRGARARYPKTLAEWIHFQELEWQTLDGHTFEMELAKFLAAEGFQVSHTGRSGDSGVDLVLTDLPQGGLTILVQCKAHRGPVGPSAVRDLYGTLSHFGGQEAWLISTHGFTQGAVEFAKGKPVHLFQINALLTASAKLSYQARNRQDPVLGLPSTSATDGYSIRDMGSK